MRHLHVFVLTGLFLAAVSCGPKENPSTEPDPVDPVPVEDTSKPTAKQLEELSDAISLAIAGDDFCKSLNAGEKSFSMTTFSGKTITMDARLDVVKEGADVSNLQNYVIDGTKFAQFHLSGETLNLPSDINQWYNPPLPRNRSSLQVLLVGDEFCQDATDMLPAILDSTGVSGMIAGRVYAEGFRISDWASRFNEHHSCYFSESSSPVGDWEILMTPNSSLLQAVAARKWDVIAVMESVTKPEGWSFNAAAKENLEKLLDSIFRTCTSNRPTVLLMLGQALPSAHEIVQTSFEGDEMKMFDAILSYGKAVTEQTVVFDVVSVAAALQNLRTTGLGLSSANGVTRDGARIDCGAGAFTAAGVIYCKIFEASMDGNDLLKWDNLKFSYPFESQEDGQIATKVDKSNIIYCRYAASRAATYPLQLSDLSSLTPSVGGSEIPGVGTEDYPVVL